MTIAAITDSVAVAVAAKNGTTISHMKAYFGKDLRGNVNNKQTKNFA